jgi:hypothetical protein
MTDIQAAIQQIQDNTRWDLNGGFILQTKACNNGVSVSRYTTQPIMVMKGS